MEKFTNIKTLGAEDKPEDKYRGSYQVYDLRDSDLEKIDLAEFTNCVIFFSSGDFTNELRSFEEALDVVLSVDATTAI